MIDQLIIGGLAKSKKKPPKKKSIKETVPFSNVTYDFTAINGETEDSGTIGTITESAVFGVIADYNTDKITVVGIGRGTSREITY